MRAETEVFNRMGNSPIENAEAYPAFLHEALWIKIAIESGGVGDETKTTDWSLQAYPQRVRT